MMRPAREPKPARAYTHSKRIHNDWQFLCSWFIVLNAKLGESGVFQQFQLSTKQYKVTYCDDGDYSAHIFNMRLMYSARQGTFYAKHLNRHIKIANEHFTCRFFPFVRLIVSFHILLN